MPQFQPNPDPGFFGLLAGLSAPFDAREEQQRLALARAAALRGQPLQPPQQPQIEQAQSAILNDVGGGASGSWGPPQQPQQPPQAPPPGPRLPQALAAARNRPPQPPMPQPMPQQGPPQPAGGPIGPQAAPDPFQARDSALQAQYAAATADLQRQMAPPDFAQAQEAYERRAQAAPQNLLLALAATEAGREFQPLAQHFMRQAAEAQAPMKTAGGTMTPEGFVQDPTFGHALQVRSAEARVANIERAMQANTTAAERQRLERERRQAQAELQQERLALQAQLAAQADETRRFVAGLTHGAKGQGAAPGKILPANTVNALTEGQQKAADMMRLAGEFRPEFAGLEGAAMNIVGKLPGVDTGAAEFWRNYKKEAELIERHGLFGASLTQGEQAAWRAADINPSMSPAAIQRNLQRRRDIMEAKYRGLVGNYGRSGYNVEAFPLPDTPQATAPAAKPAAGGLPPGWSVTTK